MTTLANKLTILALFILNVSTVVLCVRVQRTLMTQGVPVPPDKAKVEAWFTANVKPLAVRKTMLDPELAQAETGPPKIIKVRKDGKGNFKTIMEAIKSIPVNNKKRVIVSIGPGNYSERILIESTKPFVTFYGTDPKNMPVLVSSGTAKEFGTFNSATVIVQANYFVAVNVVFANAAPRPNGKAKNMQAIALRISADKSAVYNSKMHGYQDTVLDDVGRHFYKDCYVEGTTDFIWGKGTSIYLNSEIHVISGDPYELITAQGRESPKEDSGFAFLHCKITARGGVNDTFLGRPWRNYSRVVFAYTEMGKTVKQEGWSNYFNPANDRTVFYAEYKCTGPGSWNKKRARFAKNLNEADARPFINLGFLQAEKWLLPPPKLNQAPAQKLAARNLQD